MRHGRGFAVAAFVCAALALIAPLTSHTAAIERVGFLLAITAALEIAQGFRRAEAAAQRSAWTDGAVTLVAGVVLINAPLIAGGALVLLLAGWLAVDAVRRAVTAVHHARAGRPARTDLLNAAASATASAVTVALGGRGAAWAVSVAGALRIAAAGMRLAGAKVLVSADSSRTVVDDIGLPDEPEIRQLAATIEEEETARIAVDRGWIIAFGVTLFAIHLGRAGLDRSALGILTPTVAVFGDFVIALIAAYGIIVPVRLGFRGLTRTPERRLWSWWLTADGVPRRVVGAGLTARLRTAIRFRLARYSLRTALRRGLQMGLPWAAVIAATAPFFGMSWYFDTENWAAGVWSNWAHQRTDTWREAMIDAQAGVPGADPSFSVRPPGVEGDFSFVVIGDTGEGDASQQVLRDSYLDVVRNDRVKFVVVSSDIVYPVGAMRDYETKFWLPFKGTRKPVFAIPGNHDWFDTIEAFSATFLTPDAARAAMRARIEVDNRLTSTTDARIDELIAQASRLRSEYGVPTQFQQAPFFQMQTDSFALIAVDTGVARSVDPAQKAWLVRALEQARGKFTMAVLGHPFYAGGYDTTGDQQFAEIRRLLNEHGVSMVMAGDTHALEYYLETRSAAAPVHHFVNGGGGAYLSFGAALAWPDTSPTRDWAFYPSSANVVAKIQATTPWWKRPAWWWTRGFNAWPFSAEWLSGMFDVNLAPFFQSFVEVVVEPSAGRVRVIPYGIRGQLRWSDFQTSQMVRPAGVGADGLAEWVMEMPPAAR